MEITPQIAKAIQQAVQTDRLMDTAMKLVEIPSPTRDAGAVADRLQKILEEEGFTVERPEAGWSDAPAVVARFDSGKPGKTLQFNGHLDTVHLPFVPPRIEGGMFYGSGSSDMKGGIAACVEAMRALRDSKVLTAGSVLLTAHDLHETPWGDGTQVDALIDGGYLGDAVLLPEYLADPLPVISRGLAVLTIEITRPGDPVHEVLGGIEQPSVIKAGAEVIRRFSALDEELAQITHPMAGRESLFVGEIHSGEIFNQAPNQLRITGTRRWLPGTTMQHAAQQFEDLLAEIATATNTQIQGTFQVARDAIEIDPDSPFVHAFQKAYSSATGGDVLPIGAKPFVDDGNTFVSRGKIPAITHGPNATGAHTLNEEVPVDELVRVANVYALTAIAFCIE